MRGHAPHRIALTHISHHDQPQRLSGMNSNAACLPYHLVAEHFCSVLYTYGRQSGGHTHDASCILHTCSRLLTNAISLGQGHCHSCTPSGY